MGKQMTKLKLKKHAILQNQTMNKSFSGDTLSPNIIVAFLTKKDKRHRLFLFWKRQDLILNLVAIH